MNKIRKIKIAAEILPAIPLVIILLFAIGETADRNWGGLGHLIQAIPIALLMWLGWKRPFWGGIFLLVLSVIAMYSFAIPLRRADWLAPLLIVVAPLTFSGILFLSTSKLEKNSN